MASESECEPLFGLNTKPRAQSVSLSHRVNCNVQKSWTNQEALFTVANAAHFIPVLDLDH